MSALSGNIHIQEDDKCPFCKGTNLHFVRSDVVISKHYSKSSKGTFGNSMQEDGNITIPTNKYVCLDCGLTFEKIPNDALKEYREYEPFFVG